MAWRLLLSTTSCSSTLHTLKPSPPPLSYHGSSSSSNNDKLSPRPPFHSTNRNAIVQSYSFRGPLAPRGVAPCRASKRDAAPGEGQLVRNAQQAALWAAEAAYIVWLFLLPYAPGDPVWAISSNTIHDLVGLSLNFFFVLPLLNSVGIHVIEAPVLHPMSEGLFNFVIAWTLLYAPLLFTDCRRDRFKGSLELLWGFQMFLTNTFLIPYMAIRLNDVETKNALPKPSRLASAMTRGAFLVGLIGGSVCLFSPFWSLFGRSGGDFGGIAERWDFLQTYIGSDRIAYAFSWDICLYAIFQPWLIADNLENVKAESEGVVRTLRFIPVVGLVAYLVSLDYDKVL